MPRRCWLRMTSLEAAYDEGLLDILHGMIASKDTIITTLSRYASQPEGIAGIRNLLTAAKILTELDPEVLDHVSKAMANATEEHEREQKPPSLFQLAKRANSEDSRRGLSFMTLMLSGLGQVAEEARLRAGGNVSRRYGYGQITDCDQSLRYRQGSSSSPVGRGQAVPHRRALCD